MKKALIALAAAFIAVFTFADGESLAETGGFVTTTAQLAFKGITLNDLGTTYIPVARMSGGSVNDKGGEALFFHPVDADGERTYQVQMVDGENTKCSIVAFSNGDGGVYARAVNTKYAAASAYGTDLSEASDGWYEGVPAASATDVGYAVYDLGLVVVGRDSINVNIAYGGNNLASDGNAFAGAKDYIRPLSAWANVASSVGETPLESGPTVTISGVPNSGWRCSGLSTSYSLQHGYLDENGNDNVLYAPTVTITDVPYSYYKVIAYASTDTGGAQFGYVTINGVDYTSTYKSTSTAFGPGFKTTTGTDNWGHAGSDQYAKPLAEGINYLVSPVLSGDTVTVSGHRVSGSVRGCIAAVQIVGVPVLSVGDDAAAWSSGNWGGNPAPVNRYAVVSIDGDATLTIDETIDMDEVRFVGTGTLTLVTSDWESISLGSVFIDNGVTLAIDATAGLVAGPRLKALLHNGINGTVVVKGAGSNGLSMTLSDYSETYNFTTHTRFVGGVHNIYDTYGEGSTELCANSSNADPWITVADGTVLNITAHDLGGYYGTDRAASCVISVDDGGVLNINGDGSHTFYYQGRFLVAPGGVLNVAAQANNTGFRINGGTREGYEQFYVADLEAPGEKHAVVADTSGNGTGNICSASDAPVGFGVYVGANAQLDWSAPIRNGNGAAAVVKRGAGVWNLTGSVADFTGGITIAAGSLVFGADNTLNTTVSGAVSVANGVTLTVNPGASAGDVDLSDGGTIDIIMENVDAQTTVYIPFGDSMTLGTGVVNLNGAAIDTDTWELAGGKFVNKNLKTAVTTVTGDAAFSTASWDSALGDGSAIDWAGSLSEVRVTANNEAPATATVDLTAASVDTFAVDGAGDLSFVAVSGGAINASAYDFSGATGRVEYNLPTGEAPVSSGSNTLLLGGGSGVPSVAAGKTLTLGPWGATEDGVTYTYTGGTSGMFTPAAGSTLVFSPGEGKVQKAGGFGGTNTGTTIAITNGTLVANLPGGNDSVFFGLNAVRIDNGGILSLEAQDALGYYNARALTINKGGVLRVKVRDTLHRTTAMNGGKIEIYGENGNRGLDFHGLTFNVLDNSSVDQMEAVSKVGMRNGTTYVNVNDGKRFEINANLYTEQDSSLTVRAAENQPNKSGVVVLNGYSDSPMQTFTGTVTVGESGRATTLELNCEHQNGTYAVNANSRLRGSGSITGNGGVTLAAATSKLCGSLTVNNVTAANGATYGDEWNTVAAKITGSFKAGGTQTISYGSLTIGADCALTEEVSTTTGEGDDAVTTTTTENSLRNATFSVAANGNLTIEKDVAVAGLTVAAGGTITLVGAKSNGVWDVPELTVTGTPSYPETGKVNVVLDFGESNVPSNFKVKLPTGVTKSNVTVTDSKGSNGRSWSISPDGLYATSNGGFRLIIR